MPVYDLHRHLEGSHPPDAVAALAAAHGIADLADPPGVRARCVAGEERLAAAPDDAGRRRLFAEATMETRRVYVSPAAVEQLTLATCRAAALEAPDGFELRFSLFSLTRAHLATLGDPRRTVETLATTEVVETARGLLSAIVAGAKASRTPVRLRFGLSRNLEPELFDKYRAVARLAREPETRRACCGLDLFGIARSGYPEPYPPELVALLHELRRDLGDLVVHAGEFFDGDPAAPVDSVRRALSLEPDAIGHGVWSAADPALARECARRGVTLEICPESNRLLNAGGMRRLEALCGGAPAVVRLVEGGVRCVVSSDDPMVLGADLAASRRALEGLGLRLADFDAEAMRRWARLPAP